MATEQEQQRAYLREMYGSEVVLEPSDFVPLADYSRALDEIFHLRQALAYEAMCSEVHGTYKTFPKTRREALERQIERMRAAAQGRVEVAYADRPYYSMDAAMRDAGAPTTLTRHAWEAEQPEKNP